MNRRQFLTSTALALPSVTLLGAVSTQPTKTYRSPKSVFTNEELTEWCEKNGVRYAKNDELGKKFFNNEQHHVVYVLDIEIWLSGYRNYRNEYHKQNKHYECVIKDILLMEELGYCEIYGKDIIAVLFVTNEC